MLNNKTLHLILLIAIAALTPAWAGKAFPQQTGETVVPNQLIVKMKVGVNARSVIPGILNRAIIRDLNLPDHYVVSAPSLPPGILNVLVANPNIEMAEPDRIRTAITAPNDPNYNSSSQWGLFTVQAQQAWDRLGLQYLTASTASPSRLKVAVLDTGADCTHPDFMNTGGTSTDSAAGGQLSWSGSQAFVATTVTSPVCTWQDDHGHGTHVSGIISAATNNSAGVASLGYSLQLLEYKVLDSTGSGTDSNIANAITAAADAGAKVISISLGGAGYSQALQNAINYAWQNNVVVVAAAGNSSTGSLFFPGGANHAMGIAATDSSNNLASFSNYGNDIAVAAPGVSILSTIPTYSVTFGCCNYTYLSGTSMATPFVSALAGLVAATTSNATAASVIQRIEQTAAASGPWSTSFGYGIINAYNAVSGATRATSSGGIVGQITDTSGNPITSAQITVAGQAAVTDSTGLYWIRPVATGVYPISVAASGYTTQNLTLTVVAGSDTPFSVAMGASYGSFTGTVSWNGSPVPGAIVQAQLSGRITGTAVADTSGTYSLWVPAGSGYTLQASQIGMATTTQIGYAVAAGGSTTVNFGGAAAPAAAPSFNPPAGTYTSTQSVTISSTTPGVSIRYTTDGTTPSPTAGSLYTGPVMIGATTTLQAVAYSNTIPASTVSSALYTINSGSNLQVTALTCSPASLTSSATASCAVTLSGAADPSGTVVTLQSNSALLTVPPSLTVPARATTASFAATAGTISSNQTATVAASLNGSSASASISLTGSGSPTPAATPVFTPNNTSSCSGSCSITITDTDSALAGFALQYCTNASADCTPATTYTGAVSFSTSGTHLCAYATATGHIQSATHCETYTVGLPQAYTIQSQPAAGVAGTPTTCTFSPASQSGDLIVVAIYDGNYAVTPTVQDNASGGSSDYSHVAVDNSNSSYGRHRIVYAWGVASGISEVTINASYSALGGVCHLIHASAGPYTADPLDQHSTSTLFTGAGSYTAPSITPTQADGIVIATVADTNGTANSITWTTTPGWTTGGTSQLPISFGLFTEIYPSSAAAAYAPVITYAASGQTTFKFQGSNVAFKRP
jgi:thermitase